VNPSATPFTNSAATKNKSRPFSDAKFAKKAMGTATPRMASVR
jgi:hypothetical protein